MPSFALRPQHPKLYCAAMKAEQLFDVRGHVALVTGAASGLGLAYAEVMAANGAHVTLFDVDRKGLDAAAMRLAGEGGSVRAVPGDVNDHAALGAAIDAAAAERGRLDAVFANAGISAGPGYAQPAGELGAVAMEKWDQVLRTNLTSVFVTLRAAAVHMKKRGSGRIVVTASIAGLRSEPIVGYAYAATKAAVANLVRHAACELAPYGVCVNAIAPGAFFTHIGDGRLKRDPDAAKVLIERAPMKRIAQPDEIKGLALLLASPAASFLTGAVIPIDGGASAW
jgi:NAD(P)-dependent dehydrogenase (short-subunit alcohol dehydrogenase family)